MKKLVCLFLVLTFVVTLSACSQMPFNGDIEFHDISLTVPERFIRDSTQSNDDLWVFEHGNYSEYIIISRKDVTGDIQSQLIDYAEYMKETGAESEILDNNSVLSTYHKDDVLCQEILFAHSDSFYAVALRGGTQDSFEEITDTISLNEISSDLASE